MLDPENWEIAVEAYAGNPYTALQLAEQLDAIRETLQHGRKGIPNALAALDLAIDALYSHTEFHKVSHKLYRQKIAGRIKPKQENRLRELGVKI